MNKYIKQYSQIYKNTNKSVDIECVAMYHSDKPKSGR